MEMQFAHLKSLVITDKVAFTPKDSAALSVPRPRESPYIEPTLRKEKDFFRIERPSVLLISAVGASGKSALAHVLAASGNMPLLDLSRHKAVGDSTVSGLLTNSYQTSDLGNVFGGLKDGTFGIVVDGLDEGRSKTTEQGFDAFLDDIAKLCEGAPRPTFVLLGRSDIVDSAWLHFASKDVSVGLLTIEPFDRTQAHNYIDRISQLHGSPHTQQYAAARDAILNCLAAAFSGSETRADEDSFLSFIGYPPVLDAVATVLQQERNFFKLESEIVNTVGGDREIDLLSKICGFVLDREQRDKVWTNILSGLAENVDAAEAERIRVVGFSQEEQCVRLLGYCMNKPVEISVFGDTILDLQYEEQLQGFLVDHPFIVSRRFRNAVFEAYALAKAFYSARTDFHQLAMDYVTRFRSTYHLVYMCARVSDGRAFPLSHIRALIAAGLDFRSRTSDVYLDIDGENVETPRSAAEQSIRADLSVVTGGNETRTAASWRTFRFNGYLASDKTVDLGPTLADAFIYIPGKVALRAHNEIKLIVPVTIFCEELHLDAPSLSVSSSPSSDETVASLDIGTLISNLQSISIAGATLEFLVPDTRGFGYPVVNHLKKIPLDGFDPDSQVKYLRLRKILTHFRSHSKGQLAKYADKVENERVAGNQIGSAILDQLLTDGVLTRDGKFYYIDPDNLHTHLGVNWTDLRSGVVNDKLVAYLDAIEVPS